MTTNNPDVSVGPISVSERIETIDILRGFALFGILVVNMAAFMHPVFLALLPVNPQMPVWDKVVHGLIVFLAQGKFISLFSLLFGLGVAIQFDRGRLHGRPVIPVYLRRLLILFLIGCVHAFLIWPGDVLILYAVAGLGLILFRNCQLKTIWRWAVSILTVILMLMCVGFLMTEVLIRVDPQAAAELMTNGQESQWRAEAAQSYLAYSSGTYAEVTAQRIHEYSSMAGSLFAFIPQLFAMFLIGFLLGRSRLFEQVEAYRATLTKALIWCGLVGLIASGIATILTMNGYMTMGASPWFYVNAIAGLVSYPMLCMFYLCAVTLLCEQTK